MICNEVNKNSLLYHLGCAIIPHFQNMWPEFQITERLSVCLKILFSLCRRQPCHPVSTHGVFLKLWEESLFESWEVYTVLYAIYILNKNSFLKIRVLPCTEIYVHCVKYIYIYTRHRDLQMSWCILGERWIDRQTDRMNKQRNKSWQISGILGCLWLLLL